jgi:uncharacterized protein (TIGR02246 family)
MENKISPEDNAAIHETLTKLSDAWICGDGATYASLFTENARFTAAPGFRFTGNKMIEKEHQEMFKGIFKYTRIDGNYDKEIQVITADVVLVHSFGNVFFPGESEKNSKSTGLTTICVVKINGHWKIASFQNTSTEKLGILKFMGRFLFSRFYLMSGKWKKTHENTVEEKRRNIKN